MKPSAVAGSNAGKRKRAINGQDRPASTLDAPSPEPVSDQACAAEDGEHPGAGSASGGKLPQPQPAVSWRQLNPTIARLIAGWLGCLVFLCFVGLSLNLEWARPKVEEAMENCFHRHVKLSGIAWSLGLNGLSIWTDRLSMSEDSGQPFILAGKSEIGIAFLPLLQKKVIVKYVAFHHPEVFARQLSPGRWNFSDLLVEGPEIHYVEVDDGILHLRNQVSAAQLAGYSGHGVFASTKWRTYDFEKVALKLIFPKKNQRRPWPFYLSFQLPRRNACGQYTTDVSLTALCNGPFEDWQHHKCDVELRADRVNPDDWRPFIQLPPSVDALVGFNFRGQGVPAEVINGKLSAHAQDIAVASDGKTLFSAPEALATCDCSLTGNALAWNNLSMEVAGINLDSHGSVDHLQSGNPHYQAVIDADLRNLSKLKDNQLWRFWPGSAGHKTAVPLAGSAHVEVTVEGDNRSRAVTTRLKADSVPLANLLTGNGASGTPFLSFFKLRPDTPVKGQILVDKDQNIALNGMEIPLNGTVLKIDGNINTQEHYYDLSVVASGLPLDNFDTAQINPGSAPPLFLSGKVDLQAHLLSDLHRRLVDVKTTFHNATLSAGRDQLATGLQGRLAFDGRCLRFQQLTGFIDNKNGTHGALKLNGELGTASGGTCALTLAGQSVDVGELCAFCQSARLPLPTQAVNALRGTARAIEISISGVVASPALSLSITPADMTYQLSPPKTGQLKPLTISGGTIVLTGDRLELKDLPVTAQTGKLTMSGLFVGSGDALAPKTIHLRSSGIDISEVQEYMRSPDLPDQTRKMVAAVVTPLNLSSVAGRGYGDLTVNFPGSGSAEGCTMNGVIGLNDVSGQLFQQHIPFDRLNGTVGVSTDSLSLQDISVFSGASRFAVQGDVKNIQKAPLWNIKATAQFKPEDIVRFLPGNMSEGVSASSASLLTLNAGLLGDSQSARLSFAAKAAPAAAARLAGPFGSFKQPPGQALSADGTILLRTIGSGKGGDPLKSCAEFQSCRLALGSAAVQGSGKYTFDGSGKAPAAVEFVLTTPEAVPAQTLIAGFCPGSDAGGTRGTVKATLAAAGTSDSLLTHGDIILQDLTVPAWNIKDLNGRLHSPRWELGGPEGGSAGASKSSVKVRVDSATIFGIQASSIKGTLVLDNGPNPRVSLSDGSADAAGGHINVSGWFLPSDASWHLQMSMADMAAQHFVHDLIDRSGGVRGKLDGDVVLDSRGTDVERVLTNLKGHGEVSITKGRSPEVGELQEKLSQANLLQQGIFGFNINNVLQTVLPVKEGRFKDVDLSFSITNGLLSVDHLVFDGNDLRLRAAGLWNLPLNTLELEVAGDIPRVATSLLPGAVGEVSRNITLQKAVRVVTFRRLESFPSLPILGDIGADKPRAFMFKVTGSLNTPNTVQQSIRKSFRWLPNKPDASAHPVPGVPPAFLSNN